jgi:hyperosmotically inducible protein
MRKQILLTLLIVVTAVSLMSCAAPDSVVTAKIKTKMMADKAVSADKIEVDTRDGVVTLTGMVQSQEAKDHALRIARETNGARKVVDMISVRVAEGRGEAPSPERSTGERIDDAEITMRVKTRLLDDPAVKGTKIDVDTRDGVVFLTGSARTNEEKDKAIQLARNVEGVRDVQADIMVQKSG